MIETNKSYRISTLTGETKAENIVIQTSLLQDVDSIDILSVSLKSIDAYRKHSANYGVVVGRVIANNGFGIPNAKVSIFIEADGTDDDIMNYVYPFSSSFSKDENGVRYNLLPDNYVSDCHQIVGTFPNKRFMLDNDVLLEVFDKYYKFTAVTNRSGDYLICGVPVGNQTIHMDLDISDCGILSQRPRDFVYKGYNIEQFENANKFKEGTNYNELSQVFTQDRVVRVEPFWGNSENGETIGITRADIDVAFKFETTCVFMGSIGSDNASQGITEKCVPTAHMGDMDELVAGEGTIEMIRKTPNGKIEEFQIKGNQLINADGVWCYQIPMNLDYIMTDEYGNIVPTDDPNKGVATRAQVRFRISMQDSVNAKEDFYRPKILVPNNPDFDENGIVNYDYEFGSATSDDSFRDLFWNNVYSVKSYIPRFQKSKWYKKAWKDEEFSGIKHCNIFGANNPMPYNNFRVKTPFVFLFLCSVIKAFIYLVGKINTWIIEPLYDIFYWIYDNFKGSSIGILDSFGKWGEKKMKQLRYVNISDSFCPDLEGWFFIPDADVTSYKTLTEQTRGIIAKDEGIERGQKAKICIEENTETLVTCIELNLANEYKVLNFDFYNDWINGFIYIPRIKHFFKSKSRFLGISFGRDGTQGCMTDKKIKWAWGSTRQLTQMCSLEYNITSSSVRTPNTTKSKFHKDNVRSATIFYNGGVCHEKVNSFKQRIFYLRPSEVVNSIVDGSPRKVNLYANDLILLGSLNNCDIYGIPQAYKNLKSTSYILPPNLPMTNLEDGTGTLSDIISYEDGEYTKCKTYKNENGRISAYNAIEDEEGEEFVKSLFSSGESVDTVALTEIAGIAWNIDGPNQRPEGSGDKYYNPGGHFLKMSCWPANMEVKNKSCVNLSRICELGSSMSQRKKDANKIEGKDILYTNIAPTGFISNDNIIDPDIRSMFATMNSKKLLASKTNENTGYKIYDFSYYRANGFDGISKNMVSRESGYNKEIDVRDEAQDFYDKYGAAYDGGSGMFNPDAYKTKTKTFEETLSDYVTFRFGVNNIYEVNDKFLNQYNNNNVLPVFENSFYFYFGLNQGSTAIDEFNKTFFSNCESRLIQDNTPVFKAEVKAVHYDGYSQDEAVADIILTSQNVPLPWTELTYTDGENEYELTVNDTNKFIFSNNGGDEQSLKMKNYNFKLLYGEGIPLEANLNLSNHVKYNVQIQDFKVATDAYSDYLDRNLSTDAEIERGGWIMIESVNIPFLYYLDENGNRQNYTGSLALKMVDDSNREYYDNNDPEIVTIEINSEAQEPLYFFVPYSDAEYYIELKVDGIDYSYIFKNIKINRTTCDLIFLNTKGRTIKVPQDCKIDWWTDTTTYSELLSNLIPFMFDYRPEAFKTSNSSLRVPIVESRNSDLFYFGFPQKATQEGVYVSDNIFSFDNVDEQQDGYEINYEENYAGGNFWSGTTSALLGLMTLKKYGFYGGGLEGIETLVNLGGAKFGLVIQGNFYCFSSINKKTETFWHDKVGNIAINSSGEIFVTNDDAYNYIKAGYPVVVWEDETNYEIRKIEQKKSNNRLKIDITGFNNPSRLVLYPFFVFPIFNRVRKLYSRTFEYMHKSEDFFDLIYNYGNSGVQMYKDASSFACPSLFQFRIQNPLNIDVPIELTLPGEGGTKRQSYTANIYRKFNDDITVPNSGWNNLTINSANEYNPNSQYYDVIVDNASDNGLEISYGMSDGNFKVTIDDENSKVIIKKEGFNDENNTTFYLKSNISSAYIETQEYFVGECIDFVDDGAPYSEHPEDYFKMSSDQPTSRIYVYAKGYVMDSTGYTGNWVEMGPILIASYDIGRPIFGVKEYQREVNGTFKTYQMSFSGRIDTVGMTINGEHYNPHMSYYDLSRIIQYVFASDSNYSIYEGWYIITGNYRPKFIIYNSNNVEICSWSYGDTNILDANGKYYFNEINKEWGSYNYYASDYISNALIKFGAYEKSGTLSINGFESEKLQETDNGFIMKTNFVSQLFYGLINSANGLRSYYSIKNDKVDNLLSLMHDETEVFTSSNEAQIIKDSNLKNLYVLADKNIVTSSENGIINAKLYRLYKLI